MCWYVLWTGGAKKQHILFSFAPKKNTSRPEIHRLSLGLERIEKLGVFKCINEMENQEVKDGEQVGESGVGEGGGFESWDGIHYGLELFFYLRH